MSLNPILALDRPGLVGGRVQGHKRSLPWELRTVPLASLKSFRLCQGYEVLLFVVRNQLAFHCGIKINKVKVTQSVQELHSRGSCARDTDHICFNTSPGQFRLLTRYLSSTCISE